MYKLHQSVYGLLAALILLSCNQLETFEVEENGPVLFSTGIASVEEGDCEGDCIDLNADEIVYYPVSDMKSSSSGRNAKEVSYVAYNTESEFVVEVTYAVSGNSGAEAEIVIDIDGNEEVFEEVSSGSTVTYSIPLPEGWEACDEVDFSISQSGLGQKIEFAATYGLIGICPEECEIRTATAYVGDMLGEKSGVPGSGFNNAWWYVFDLEGEAEQVIYADNDEPIGTATYDELEGTITLDLGDWNLAEDEDNSVKWYSYADGELHTDGRPTPGLAPNKGNSLVIGVNDDRYYAIHLDVEICE